MLGVFCPVSRLLAGRGVCVMKRVVGQLLMSVAALVTMSACVDTGGVGDARDVVVRPRVVVEGTVELGDRTGGRVLLNSITAHAHDARLQVTSLDGQAEPLVVLDGEDPLFFSYSPNQPDAQQAAERTWSLPVVGGDLYVGFGPADPDAVAGAPFDASSLAGHTVVITGSIAIASDDAAGFGAGHDVIGDDSVAEVDPDGTPARPISEVDPDGTPAQPTGVDSEVDPDGTPAQPPDSDVDSEVDPDGTPAQPPDSDVDSEVDPDGTPAQPPDSDVDPDGTPAVVADTGGQLSQQGAHKTSSKTKATMEGLNVRHQVRVPFTLTVDGAFEHQTALSAEAIAAVDAGDVLPIDLRFAAAEFFNAERLAVLGDLAAEAVRTGDKGGAALQVSASTTARLVDVQVHASVKKVKAAPKTSSRIVVTGPTGPTGR